MNDGATEINYSIWRKKTLREKDKQSLSTCGTISSRLTFVRVQKKKIEKKIYRPKKQSKFKVGQIKDTDMVYVTTIAQRPGNGK